MLAAASTAAGACSRLRYTHSSQQVHIRPARAELHGLELPTFTSGLSTDLQRSSWIC